jgi:predicted transcriptional regulator
LYYDVYFVYIANEGVIMPDVTISARIPEDLKGDLTVLARALRRTPSWVIEEALRDYITREKDFLAAIDEGIQADDAGDLAEHADVVAELDQIIAQRRKSQ